MDELTEHFAQVLDFTEADLASNRLGVLSEKQQAQLRQHYRKSMFRFALFSSAFPVLSVGFLRLRAGIPPGLPLWAALTTIFWLVLLSWIWILYCRRLAAIRAQQLEIAEGELRFEEKSVANAKVLYLSIGKAEYPLPTGDRKQLLSRQGRYVRAYAIPKLKRLVSLETG